MDRHDVDAPLRVMTMLWLFLIMGVITFGGVAYGLLTSGTMGVDAIEPTLLSMIAPVLMVMMVGGIVVGNRLERAIPRGAPPAERIHRYQAARIVAMASQEGPALAIMILSLLAGERTWVIAAAALGIWTLFLARPRREDLEALLRD